MGLLGVRHFSMVPTVAPSLESARRHVEAMVPSFDPWTVKGNRIQFKLDKILFINYDPGNNTFYLNELPMTLGHVIYFSQHQMAVFITLLSIIGLITFAVGLIASLWGPAWPFGFLVALCSIIPLEFVIIILCDHITFAISYNLYRLSRLASRGRRQTTLQTTSPSLSSPMVDRLAKEEPLLIAWAKTFLFWLGLVMLTLIWPGRFMILLTVTGAIALMATVPGVWDRIVSVGRRWTE